ncbi:MAG: conjugal transfer protein TraF [Fimbriimonadaceae bacterium]|nr:conjugal transfer protein TraF [Fimbriimonadaceae bacterium]
MTNWKLFGIAAAVACLTSPALADLGLGGSRSAGMGGAGLALGNDPEGPGARNPAWYALNPRNRFSFPNLRYTFDGIGWGELDDFFGSASSGALDSDRLGELARTFGHRDVRFGLGLGFGFQAGSFGLDLRADGNGLTTPNASLAGWVAGGSNLAAVPADARLDGYGLARLELGLSLGQKLDVPIGDLAVGGRLKITRSYYNHSFAGQAEIISGTATGAVEMNGQDVLEETGIGLDLGANLEPSALPGLSLTVVWNNFIEPSNRINASVPFSLTREGVKPFSRSLDLGAAYRLGPITGAFDLIDVFSEAGPRDVRIGGEAALGRLLAVRTGWSSLFGPTIGAGIGGFNISYAQRLPLQAGYAIRF